MSVLGSKVRGGSGWLTAADLGRDLRVVVAAELDVAGLEDGDEELG